MMSGLKILGWIINAILYLVVIALWISIPDELKLCLSITVVTLILTIVMVVLDRERLAVIYESSQFTNFAQAFTAGILLFGILGMLNYLAWKNPIQWDVTGNNTYTLTDQTIKIVKNAKEDMRFLVFAKRFGIGPLGAPSVVSSSGSNLISLATNHLTSS